MCSTATAPSTTAAASATANPDSLNQETAAATPCPEVCEQTPNTGECPAGKQIF